MQYSGHSGQHSDLGRVLQLRYLHKQYLYPRTCKPNLRPTSLLFNRYRRLFAGVKRPGRKPHDYSTLSSANAKSMCGNTSTPLYALMACLQTMLPLPLSVIVCILFFNTSQLT